MNDLPEELEDETKFVEFVKEIQEGCREGGDILDMLAARGFEPSKSALILTCALVALSIDDKDMMDANIARRRMNVLHDHVNKVAAVMVGIAQVSEEE
jgi:hypothetical protein